MIINFHKLHGTGNDFILIDNRQQLLRGDEFILFAKLCTRRFGIGADGLILIEDHPELDFEMKYYNADGRPSTLCGNGGRCAIRFASNLGIIGLSTVFQAVDGPHEGKLHSNKLVGLKMANVSKLVQGEGDYVLDTGSPHYVKFVRNLDEFDVVSAGKKIRYSDVFSKQGINVNFVEFTDDGIKVRTYERGVEDETYSCGTGVVAAALATAVELGFDQGIAELKVRTLGGNLKVDFHIGEGEHFSGIWLTGAAQYVYSGSFDTMDFL
ncbi:MAG: diaminopimelate epimerase [Chitinophagales bacterium]|nr:diaminopimelate epimerase [Chitinophagales bacterium]